MTREEAIEELERLLRHWDDLDGYAFFKTCDSAKQDKNRGTWTIPAEWTLEMKTW